MNAMTVKPVAVGCGAPQNTQRKSNFRTGAGEKLLEKTRFSFSCAG
jgi:hypothetical protein